MEPKGKIVKGVNKPCTRRRVIKLVIIAVASLLIVAAGVILRHQIIASKSLCNSRADSAIYKEASAHLNPNSVDRLKPVVQKIKRQKGFEKDQNCLYPIVVYYMNVREAKNVDKYYKQLRQAYTSNSEFAKVYHSHGVKKLEQLEQRMEIFQWNKGDDNFNTVYF